MTNEITIQTPDGAFNAYVALPTVVPAPVVVIIQEIFGVTKGIRQIADELAVKGFVAVCRICFGGSNLASIYLSTMRTTESEPCRCIRNSISRQAWPTSRDRCRIAWP
jgi:dienelactone hydrolase